MARPSGVLRRYDSLLAFMVRGHYSEVCRWLCACTLCVCLMVVVHVCYTYL